MWPAVICGFQTYRAQQLWVSLVSAEDLEYFGRVSDTPSVFV